MKKQEDSLIDRRECMKRLATSLALFQFYKLAIVRDAIAGTLKPDFENWIRAIEIDALQVRSGKMKLNIWQGKMDRLHNRVPLEDVLRFTDLEKVLKIPRAGMKEKIASVHDVPWPKLGQDSPAEIPFGHKLYIYRKGDVTPPHAHNHLVSAHLIIKGKIRVRTYNRIEDTNKGIVIKPTQDEILGVGSVVTMSDMRDNVHWFVSEQDQSVSFDIAVPDIEPEKKYKHKAQAFNQIFLDPTVAPRVDGKIEAPIIPFAEALRRFA